jgi:type VI protein secretion system component VasK
MTTERRIGPEGRDDDLTRELRRLYAAPADDAYWRALEARIVAAVSTARTDAWWQPLARWARPGAVAAAIAVALAGAALWKAREAREEYAIQAAMLQSNAPAAQLAAAAGARPDNDAVVRDALTP